MKSFLQKITEHLKLGRRVSIDYDEWTSCSNRRYLNVSLFTNHEYWNLGLVRIIGSATAENILTLVKSRLSEFGIEFEKHVVCSITDGAAVMKKIRRISGSRHQLCVVHGIQLAVTDVLYSKAKQKKNISQEENEDDDDNVESGFHIEACDDDSASQVTLINASISSAIGKLRKLAAFFKRSSLNNEKLQGYVKSHVQKSSESKSKPISAEKPLKLDSKTRWSSLYLMVQRYWEIRDSIDHTLVDIHSDIYFTSRDKYIYYCLMRTLRPVMLTVEVRAFPLITNHQLFIFIAPHQQN
jgi:hypothetical protein